MNASLPPESGIPPSGDNQPPIPLAMKLRTRIACASDALSRAFDMLSGEDDAMIDLNYVDMQLHHCSNAVARCFAILDECENEDDYIVDHETTLVETDHRDPFLPQDVDPPMIGGEA